MSQLTFACSKSTVETCVLMLTLAAFQSVSFAEFKQVNVSWGVAFVYNLSITSKSMLGY